MRVGHLLHPVDGFAVLDLLDGDMGHRGGRRRAVPVLFARREPDDVAGPDFLDRAALALRAAEPAVTTSVCPSGWVCQAVRAPGSKVTLAPARARDRSR